MRTEIIAAVATSATTPIQQSENSATRLWLSTAEFSGIAGISRQKAYTALFRCLNGGTWRGSAIRVRAVEGAGGQGGKALQAYIPSLPKALRATWKASNPATLAAHAVEPIALPAPAAIDSDIARRVAEWKWKLQTVAPALAYPKHSAGRAAMLREIANTQHTSVNGKPVTVAISTLRAWLVEIETGNEAAIARPRRADRGRRRHFINRQWDKACQLPEPEKRRIATEIETYIRSLWRSGVESENKINSMASTKLAELSRAAGWVAASPKACAPGLYLVRLHQECRLIATKEKNAKGFHDHFIPRIQRSRNGLQPMDIVIGDVHPVDIYIRREDGTTATPRMIAWLDVATNDLFYTLVLLPKGRGITQAHIVKSFVDMVQAWGLPRALYLDNGTEYSWDGMIEGFNALQGIVESFRVFLASAAEIDSLLDEGGDPAPSSPPAITRARPYNAQAKAIEGVFAALEKFFKLIPGYVGGDRTKKRTHRLGKAPNPYTGAWEKLEADIAEMVAFYRAEKQCGTMNGKSPNDRKRDAIESGWRPVTAGPEVFIAAFASAERVRVHTGGIRCGDDWYYHDVLIPAIGEMIEIRFAKWDARFALWVADDGRYTLIPKATYYHPMDRRGAVEQGRRTGLQKAEIMRLTTDAPRIDLVAEVARHNAALPPPPKTPAGTPILLDSETRQAAKAIKHGANQPVIPASRLAPGEYVDGHGKIRTIFPQPPLPAPPSQAKPHIADLLAARASPKTPKPDASADAPGFDVHAEVRARNPIHHDKETDES